MNFCENCNVLVDGTRCHVCNGKKLRAVTGDDYCYFVSLETPLHDMFEYTLKENGIDCVSVPYYPSGVTYFNAGRARGRRMYLRYRDFDAAKEIYEMLFSDDGKAESENREGE